jgi:hypothetical protein
MAISDYSDEDTPPLGRRIALDQAVKLTLGGAIPTAEVVETAKKFDEFLSGR